MGKGPSAKITIATPLRNWRSRVAKSVATPVGRQAGRKRDVAGLPTFLDGEEDSVEHASSESGKKERPRKPSLGPARKTQSSFFTYSSRWLERPRLGALGGVVVVVMVVMGGKFVHAKAEKARKDEQHEDGSG